MTEKEGFSSVQIKQYTPEDHADVRLNLEQAGIFDEKWDSEKSLQKAIELDPETILVAVSDDKVVGSVYINNWWGVGGWVYHLAVREGYREQGVGTRLMEEAERKLNAKGVTEVALFVEEGNTYAKDFYERRDYEEFPGRYISMVKKL